MGVESSRRGAPRDVGGVVLVFGWFVWRVQFMVDDFVRFKGSNELWNSITVWNPVTQKYCKTKFVSREWSTKNGKNYVTVTMNLIPIESAGGGANNDRLTTRGKTI